MPSGLRQNINGRCNLPGLHTLTWLTDPYLSASHRAPYKSKELAEGLVGREFSSLRSKMSKEGVHLMSKHPIIVQTRPRKRETKYMGFRNNNFCIKRTRFTVPWSRVFYLVTFTRLAPRKGGTYSFV